MKGDRHFGAQQQPNYTSDGDHEAVVSPAEAELQALKIRM